MTGMLSFNLSDFATFSGATQWVFHHDYWVIFIAMLIEGPIVTAAAAFGSALGYFSFFSIFILSILGDLVADVVYYAIGYWGRFSLVERFGKRVGLSKERMIRMEHLLHDHAWKTMIALKLTPILPTPGLMLVGTTRMPLRKYVTICVTIILPKALLFMLIGYYFGKSYDKITHYMNNGAYAIIGIIALVVLVDWLFRRFSAKLGRKVVRL